MERVEIIEERCKSCGYCVKYCPKEVLAIGSKINSKGFEYVVALYPEKCTSCCICAEMCPDGAITIYK